MKISAKYPQKYSVLLVGCGRMGGALAEGWLAADIIGTRLWIVDPQPIPASLASDPRVAVWTGEGTPDVIVLAIKPQLFRTVLPTCRPWAGHRPLILSIAAGISIGQIAGLLADYDRAYCGPIVRTMPNTPAAIGQGITALVANAATDPAVRQQAECLMAACGDTLWLADEDMMHAVTAISGSGPAYVFAFIEALSRAGEALGLAPDIAARLASATVTGSAALAAHSHESPATLRRNVTSPNGTTAAGLAVLQNQLPELLHQTTRAAAARSRALAVDSA